MPINHAPKVGEILVCNFGDYPKAADGTIIANDFNGHIPPEMIKNRLVVVLNGKINGNACLVVPLSATCDQEKTRRGMHVEIPANAIPTLYFFSKTIRWAKTDLIQQVSKQRLQRPRAVDRGSLSPSLLHDTVTKIQLAVIKSINASSLLAVAQPKQTPITVTVTVGSDACNVQ